jgi:hypothetical protein
VVWGEALVCVDFADYSGYNGSGGGVMRRRMIFPVKGVRI